jgi:hypothetical protein
MLLLSRLPFILPVILLRVAITLPPYLAGITEIPNEPLNTTNKIDKIYFLGKQSTFFEDGFSFLTQGD